MVPLSILDLAPIVQGSDAGQALANSLDLARHAEASGYDRIWYAEHHNMPGIASAATAVVIGHIAAGTKRIRVGAGGIMLPNHAPYVVAEQFGTLAALHPGRIELGLGRAPGTDQRTARALRRTLVGDVDGFPDDVVELMSYLGPPSPDQAIQAIPGSNSNLPIWILGSSLFGAQLAAALGLPYAFASHFAPALLTSALEVYRSRFKPSAQWPRPHVMLGVNVIAAARDEEAQLLKTSIEQAFVQLRRGRPVPLPPPLPGFDQQLAPHERAQLDEIFACSFVGTPDSVAVSLEDFAARTGADELMVAGHIYDHQARLESYRLLAEVAGMRPVT
ncbi:MAG TPA: LLM class flavin-dependent oxidoreductase [Polyangia bacterium]